MTVINGIECRNGNELFRALVRGPHNSIELFTGETWYTPMPRCAIIGHETDCRCQDV